MGVRGNSYPRRLLRRLWAGSNPLRRRTDWFETIAFIGVVLATAVSLTLTMIVSDAAKNEKMEQVRAEQATRHQVGATVIEPLHDDQRHGGTAKVRWGEPGRETSAATHVGRPVAPNDTVTIWVDGDNRLTTPPMSAATASHAAGSAGAAVLIVGALTITLCYASARWWINRRRMAAWEAEWAIVGPQWRRRAGH